MKGGVKALASAIAALSCLALPAHAADLRKDARLTQGPPIHEIESPYDPALECLATQLTPEQKSVSFSPGYFMDRTGKTNYVSDSGTGNFSTQGQEDMIITSLYATGVQVTDMGASFKSNVDWIFSKFMLAGSNAPSVSLMYPDVIISGGITSFDFLPGGGFAGNVAGIKLGHQQSRILVAMDARAVLMPGAKLAGPGGKVLAVDRSSKQIVGYQDDAGATGFFGPKDSPTFISLDFGHRPNEAIQFAERIMVDRFVFMLVADVFNISACDPQLEYGDTVANLK